MFWRFSFFLFLLKKTCLILNIEFFFTFTIINILSWKFKRKQKSVLYLMPTAHSYFRYVSWISGKTPSCRFSNCCSTFPLLTESYSLHLCKGVRCVGWKLIFRLPFECKSAATRHLYVTAIQWSPKIQFSEKFRIKFFEVLNRCCLSKIILSRCKRCGAEKSFRITRLKSSQSLSDGFSEWKETHEKKETRWILEIHVCLPRL